MAVAAVNSTDEFRIALVCLSNLNRSMEAHNLFLKNGIRNVSSFGSGLINFKNVKIDP